MKFSKLTAFVVGFLVSATVAFAQQVVNQGSPGQQGPWPVTMVAPSFPSDGGSSTIYSSVGVYPYPCRSTSPNSITYMDAGVQNTPNTAATNRLYTIICNSKDNSTGNLRCRADGTSPVIASGTAGDVLAVGDCIPYTNSSGAPVKCIGTDLWVSTYECVK